MGMIVRFLFPLTGYVAVATVITLVAGYGHLRRSGNLDDQRMFQIVSILHGIDTEEIAKQHETDLQDVPPEEQSYRKQQELRQIAALHFQAKADDLDKQKSEFLELRRQVNADMKYYRSFREEVEKFLNKRRDEALQAGMQGVRKQWETLIPRKQTKELLKMMIAEDHTDVVILLLNDMPSRKSTDILKTLDGEEDLDMLYKIQKQMLAGNPVRNFIDGQIEQLQKRQQLENQ
ncbi:MAG: hypothetical protein CMJ72_10005 [Planctomycetaceae bacterium]|nr:hypothetical protein [Planctomycetaceae bacterium]HCK42530.1 hypothetical protein [Planctomycetaceae bacterium]